MTTGLKERVDGRATRFDWPHEEKAGSEHFYAVLDKMRELHDKKQKDYGAEGDPFANVRASGDFGVPPWVGCLIRANDKVRRIQAFAKKGRLENESCEDSLLDLAVYSVIGLCLFYEHTNNLSSLTTEEQ